MQDKSTDPAVQQMIEKAKRLGVITVWDRYAAMQPQCGFGETGLCCRHCEDAPCMYACISGAISRDAAGVVTTNTDKCIGCWTCVMVCPYGVIVRPLETHKAYRCDRCPDREEPACVSSCPTKTLVYRTVEEFSADARQAAAVRMLAEKGG